MKVTILGTANAWGPNPFLDSPPKVPMVGTLLTGEEVEFRKYRTSILVEGHDGTKILVDCGPDFSHQLRAFQFGVVDAIFITHSHPDHIGGLDELNLYRPTKRLPIPVYATEACWRCLEGERGFGYLLSPLNLVSKNILLLPGSSASFSIGSIKVTPFCVEHHLLAPGAVGFVFEEVVSGRRERLLYTGDLWGFTNPADDLFRQPIDLAIIECDRWGDLSGSAVGGGHMSFVEALRILKSGALSNPQPRQVTFVHFGDNGPVGTISSYQDWRGAIIAALQKNGLEGVMPVQDIVVGYEGMSVILARTASESGGA